jgi:flagellar biosynthesis protein FlhG
VGGGKGGVGKSVVAANLAAAIAGTGVRCALVDADLGAANLHTLLGVSRPRRTLAHFLAGEVASLQDLLVQSSVPNLWLVSGSQALLEMANPKHSQKLRLLRHIRRLDVDHVVLDLSAGSAFNVLDFFLASPRGLVVVTPEPTALDNAEHFLAAAFHRWLRGVARRPEVRAALLRLGEDRRRRPARSAPELIDQVREIDPPAAARLEERARAFAPILVMNQVRSTEQRQRGPELAASCGERLGLPLALAATLDADPAVEEALARCRPVLQVFPRCRFSRQLELLTWSLLRDERERRAQERADASAADPPATRQTAARPAPSQATEPLPLAASPSGSRLP